MFAARSCSVRSLQAVQRLRSRLSTTTITPVGGYRPARPTGMVSVGERTTLRAARRERASRVLAEQAQQEGSAASMTAAAKTAGSGNSSSGGGGGTSMILSRYAVGLFGREQSAGPVFAYDRIDRFRWPLYRRNRPAVPYQAPPRLVASTKQDDAS
jgi:hypothetical protein